MGGSTCVALATGSGPGSLDTALRAAMERGAVLCGGSAGAICWFDGGHSDSMDPDGYLGAALARLGMKMSTRAGSVTVFQRKERCSSWRGSLT